MVCCSRLSFCQNDPPLLQGPKDPVLPSLMYLNPTQYGLTEASTVYKEGSFGYLYPKQYGTNLRVRINSTVRGLPIYTF